MIAWVDASCILIVLCALAVLATYRIAGMIEIFAAQSIVLGIVPFFLHFNELSARTFTIALGTIALKGLLVPYILFWAIRHVSMRSEVKPLIGFGSSIVCGALIVAGAFGISQSLRLPGRAVSELILPCSLAAVMLGFMIMVTRVRAVTQVLGYLIMENGIFLFALALFDAMPMLIEMGILLDIFAAVFIMAIVVNHINEEFERAPDAARTSRMGESS